MPQNLAAKISGEAEKSFGQRREVTVLFVDVANFTATTNAIESEEAFLFINEIMRLLVEVIYKYEGTVDKFTGDGLMALFGAPVSHENDPERAVRAALEMQQVVKPVQARMAERRGYDLQMRIGVNTGTVIAGRLGNDLHMEYTVIGDTVNLASRLESAAEPGTVLVSYATYQRTRPLFYYRILPPISVKGFAKPIRANQPLRLREQPGALRGLPGLRVPMIGRQAAARRLEEALGIMLQTRQLQVALVTADAGLGKSRLVTEFTRCLPQHSVNFYQGGCLTYARSRPMWVVSEVLRDIIGLNETESDGHQGEKVQAYLQQLGLSEEEDLPYVLHTLGLAQRSAEIATRLELLDAGMLQTQTYATLRQFILKEASLNPLVLIFEDLHWVDPASRAFLEHLLQTTEEAALMVVLVSRQVERTTVIKPLVDLTQARPDRLTDIELTPLSQHDTNEMINHLIAEDSSEAMRLKSQIAQRAGGIPLYTEEIVRMLMEQHGLIQTNNAWQTTPQATMLLNDVPATVKGLILTRADRLSPELYGCLQRAAVCGRSFPLGLFQSLNGYTPNQIQKQLDELVEREFLVPEPFGTEQGYTFRHDLILGTLYGTLMQRDRSRLHERVATTIEHTDYWSADEQVEVLAYHYSESTNSEKAIHYLSLAAENASRRHSHEIAIQHYEQASELLRQQTDSEDERFIKIWNGLGRALKFAGDFSRAGEILLRSIEHLASSTWPEAFRIEHSVQALRELADLRIREGSLDQAMGHLQNALTLLGTDRDSKYPDLLQSLLDRSAWVRFRQGRLDEAFMLARSAVNVLDESPEQSTSNGNPIVQASLFNTMGGISWQRGNLSDATEYVKRSLEMHKAVNYTWGMAIANTNLGVLYFSRGLWPKAITHFQLADKLHRDNGYLPEQALNLTNLGQLRASLGDHNGARHDYEASLTMSTRMGDEFALLQAQLGLAHLSLVKGEIAQAHEHLQEAEAHLEAAGTDQSIQLQWMRAQILGAQGEALQGKEIAEAALEKAKAAGLIGGQADCERILGQLYAQLTRWSEAEQVLQNSISVCRQHSDLYRQGQSLMELGRLYEQIGNEPSADTAKTSTYHHQARVAYQSAQDLFTELQAKWDLEQAQAAQQRLVLPTSSQDGLDGGWYRVAILKVDLIFPKQGNVDADELRYEVLTELKPQLVAIVEEHDGLYQEQSDGLVAFFGIPVSHEDDPARCVDTGIRLQNAVAQYAKRHRLALNTAAAAAFGDVVAGMGDSEHPADLVVTGAPVLQAESVCEVTPPSLFWVTGPLQAAARYRYNFITPSALVPNHLGQDGVFEVTGVRQRPESLRGLSGNKVPLIGRHLPMQAMLKMADRLKTQSGGLIWLEGDAGIGKSRMMREFSDTMARHGTQTWAGHCTSQRADSAFSLFANMFRSVFDVHTTDRPDQIRRLIEKVMASWPKECQAERSYVEMLFGLHLNDEAAQRLAGLEPDQVRQQIFVSIRRILRAHALEKPLILLLDDVQWIDPISAELLFFLNNMVVDTPILFVCTYRSGETDLPNPFLDHARGLHPSRSLQLQLENLSESESRLFLDELLPKSKLPEKLVQKILAHSSGNPFFVEEYVRMLLEQEYLIQTEPRAEDASDLQMNPGKATLTLPLPENLQALLRSRYDSLSYPERTLLKAASVIGNPVDVRLLKATMGESNVAAILAQLEKRHLMEPLPTSGQWGFRHTLVETVVYQSMLGVDRRRLHLEVATALEVQLGSDRDEHAETLAYHLTLAEQPQRSLIYLVLAGERAASRHSNQEAFAFFARAQTLLDEGVSLAASDDAEVDAQRAKKLTWRVVTGQANVQRFMGKYDAARALLEANEELAEEPSLSIDQRAAIYRMMGQIMDKQSDLGQAKVQYEHALLLLDNPVDTAGKIEMARILCRLAWNQYLQGNFEEALTLGTRSIVWANDADAKNDMATAQNILGGIYARIGLLDQALHHTQLAMDLRQEIGYSWGVASGLSNLGVLAALTGDWEQAMSFFQRSLVLNQELGNVEGQVIVNNNLGMLSRDQGKLEDALDYFSKGVEIASSYHMGYQLANTRLGLAMTLNQAGRGTEAMDLVGSCLAQAAALGAKDITAEAMRIKAEILLSWEQWTEAREAGLSAAKQAGEIGNPALASAAWRAVSESERLQGHLFEADQACERAVQSVASVNELLETGRVKVQQARVLLAKNEAARARLHVLEAQTIFKNIRAAIDLQQVQSLLDETMPGEKMLVETMPGELVPIRNGGSGNREGKVVNERF